MTWRPKEYNTIVSTPVLHLCLTHWGRATHTCVSKLTIIGSDNGLLPGRRQAITWTNAGLLLITPWGTNFSEILIGILTFSFKKMHLKISSAKCRPSCLGLNVLKWPIDVAYIEETQGYVPIWRCHLTTEVISIIKKTWSHNCLSRETS